MFYYRMVTNDFQQEKHEPLDLLIKIRYSLLHYEPFNPLLYRGKRRSRP